MEQAEKMSAYAKATARQSSLCSTTRAKTGGKGIRTPDFQLAKLVLYQLSYAPCELSILDWGSRIANASGDCACWFSQGEVYQPWASLLSIVFTRPKPDVDFSNRHPAFRFFPAREDLFAC